MVQIATIVPIMLTVGLEPYRPGVAIPTRWRAREGAGSRQEGPQGPPAPGVDAIDDPIAEQTSFEGKWTWRKP